MYFTDEHYAVLVLEADDKAHAREILGQLPLVQQKLIDLELMAITAYPGFAGYLNDVLIFFSQNKKGIKVLVFSRC